MSCEYEPNNQAIYSLAKEHDPAGERTLGCLTKPDRIEEKHEPAWAQLMSGDGSSDFFLKLGWHMVKNPSKAEMERGVAGAAARGAEADFFTAHTYFGGSVLAGRLGVPVLREKMSGLLTALISRQLPVIAGKVADEMAAVQKELATLPPPPPSNPTFIINKVQLPLEPSCRAAPRPRPRPRPHISCIALHASASELHPPPATRHPPPATRTTNSRWWSLWLRA